MKAPGSFRLDRGPVGGQGPAGDRLHSHVCRIRPAAFPLRGRHATIPPIRPGPAKPQPQRPVEPPGDRPGARPVRNPDIQADEAVDIKSYIERFEGVAVQVAQAYFADGSRAAAVVWQEG